ncbi:hypothetical protein [Microbacterium sp. XT11]|uniref:hypothetical protein n=1 Tax=Microbacterium sp. XT11 TaxID=367477 RepID=UPI0008300D4B|nr:hypothetical protein [Microbacterium sp. XT11]
MIDLLSYIVSTVILGGLGLLLLYFVVRGAVRSAMRSHALWLAGDRYERDLEAYKRSEARYGG